MTLFVGTSGWAYAEWKPDFYPQEVPRSKFLSHYATRLTACEINATFYRLQKGSTVVQWAQATPESFRFAAKSHRRITHARSIAPDPEQRGFVDAFVESLGPFGPRLGAVLLQFPPYRSRDDQSLRALIQALPPGMRFACEFRHPSWDAPEVGETIAELGGTVCISDTQGGPPETLPDGPLGYVRLRTDRYSPEARTAWMDLLTKEATERDVYAFAKHEGISASDEFGGIGLAVWLRANAT
jgi:uncharacterized protein YecE (DUF72 family)